MLVHDVMRSASFPQLQFLLSISRDFLFNKIRLAAAFGDNLDDTQKGKWQARLNKLLGLEEPWILIIDDALANSFLAPSIDDIKDGHQLSFEKFNRPRERNEELVLDDMDTSSADVAYNVVDAGPNGETEV